MTTIFLMALLLLVSVEAFTPAMKNKALPLQPQRRMAMAISSSDREYSVEVSYEGCTCETLLAAMERTGAADRLSLPSLPYDCRRGNCLTCSGRHMEGSSEASLHRGDDGLSPHMSKAVKKAGYLLTCSSFVVGNGLKVQLGVNDRVWNDMYRFRMQDDAAVRVAREAMARVIRLVAEENITKWKKETEEILKKTD